MRRESQATLLYIVVAKKIGGLGSYVGGKEKGKGEREKEEGRFRIPDFDSEFRKEFFDSLECARRLYRLVVATEKSRDTLFLSPQNTRYYTL